MSDMQNTHIRDTLSGFGPVWQRVTGTEKPHEPPPPPPPPRDEADTLRSLLRREQQIAFCGFRLAAMFRGRTRAKLNAQAAASRERARTLRTELFLRCGDRQFPREGCPRTRDRLSALRDAIGRDQEAAREYTAAAERTGDRELRRQFGEFAEQLEAAARQKRAILRGMI